MLPTPWQRQLVRSRPGSRQALGNSFNCGALDLQRDGTTPAMRNGEKACVSQRGEIKSTGLSGRMLAIMKQRVQWRFFCNTPEREKTISLTGRIRRSYIPTSSNQTKIPQTPQTNIAPAHCHVVSQTSRPRLEPAFPKPNPGAKPENYKSLKKVIIIADGIPPLRRQSAYLLRAPTACCVPR